MEVTSTTYLTVGFVSDELHKMFRSTVDATLHVFMKIKPLFEMFLFFFCMSVFIVSSPEIGRLFL